MAVAVGTNAGFLTEAPTGDPSGSASGTIDNYVRAQKDTTPADCTKIIEIGWYCANATEAADFDVGIYDHDSTNDQPKNLVGSSTGNAKGTDAGWKRVTGLSIDVSASTVYWIAVTCDNTATATGLDRSSDSGERYSWDPGVSTLLDPFQPQSNVDDYAYAIYAVYETSTATGLQINIGDSWKTVDAVKINIGDAWKDVEGIQINIGDAWKTVM